MAFQVSPGVLVQETDLTNIIPAVSTSIAGAVLTAEKGPIDELTLLSSEKELVLNKNISPFQIYIANLNSDNPEVKETSDRIYSDLINSGYDVLFDDRDEGPGVKFNDYELSGVPVRIVISKRSLENSEAEILERGEENFKMIKIENIVKELANIL